ncbi:hypothetical protein GCM10008908_18960 [Clostridium subterminale]|uniref:DUF3919 family protein n=1 Tax=Clostridium subterminale TaxID=1550 RepID=A0ABP3W1P2_CLOSU
MRNRSSKGVGKTIILLMTIVVLGYFITLKICSFLPSYKYQVKEIENVNSVKRLFYLEEEPIIYPWSYLDKGDISIIPDEDKAMFYNNIYTQDFQGKNIVDFIDQMMNLSAIHLSDDEIINSFQYLKNIQRDKDGYDKILILNDDFTNLNRTTYNVKFSFGENGQVSYRCKRVDDSKYIDNKTIEKSYKLLEEYARNEDSKLVNYLKNIYKTSQQNYAHEIIDVLNNIIVIRYTEDGYVKVRNYLQDINYEIFSTESELMLIYTLEDGTMLILYFDPVNQEFCGFNIQKN